MCPLCSISCSSFSAFCLNPCVMKNAVLPSTAPNAIVGFCFSENHTTADKRIDTIA